MHRLYSTVALVVLGSIPAVALASGPPIGRVEAADVGRAKCYGWSSATDTAYVMRQKEACAADGCTLGAYLARVGTNSRAQTVSYVGVAKNPAGRAQLSVLVASAKPKFTDAASDAVAKEADLGCLTEAPNVSVPIGGHEVSVGAQAGAIVVQLDGRAIPVGTLATSPMAEQVEAIHYSPDQPSLLVRVRGESDTGSDVRFVHVAAGKLGLATTSPSAAKTPAAPATGGTDSATPPPVEHVPPADPVATPHELWGWPVQDSSVGWNTTTLNFYVVRERNNCVDEQGLDCSRSVAMMEVAPKRAKAIRALWSGQGDRASLDDMTIPDARYKSFNAASKADVGCKNGATGTLPGGRTFAVSQVSQAGDEVVSLVIDSGAPTTVGVLTNRERREDVYGDVHPGLTESIVAVYSHPNVDALVIEIGKTTDTGFDSRFLYLDKTALQPRVARTAPVATKETPEEAARTPITHLAVSMPGRRCLGWSKAQATAYIVVAKDYCIDVGGEECDASVGVQGVSGGGAKTVVPLASAHGGMTAIEGRLLRAATDAVLDGAERTVTPLLEVGCVVGESGTVAGKPFEVLVNGRSVTVSVAGGAAKKVLTLGRDVDSEESGHYSHSNLSAVYSHPEVPALVFEVEDETDRGTSVHFTYMDKAKLGL